MLDCQNPYSEVKFNADLVSQLARSRAALEECNAQVRSLRAWADAMRALDPEHGGDEKEQTYHIE